jgi:dolichol-phosphate mannosyltransferase
MKVWILLPAYNEEASLVTLLNKTHGALSEAGIAHQIVVVNDGSSDKTPDILRDQESSLPLSTVIHPINRGLGETERDGFEYVAAHSAPDDVVVRMDCDDTHEAKYIPEMLKQLAKGYDVVSASRFQPGGGQVGVDGYRAFISEGANVFMKLMFHIPGLKDYSCGFRAYRAKTLQDAVAMYRNNFIQLRGLGFTSTLETIVKLHLMGARFSEVGFVLRYDQKKSGSKMVSSTTTLGYLLMALLYWWPFGGWRRRYRGLGKLYRESPERALEKFSLPSLRRRLAGDLSL